MAEGIDQHVGKETDILNVSLTQRAVGTWQKELNLKNLFKRC